MKVNLSQFYGEEAYFEIVTNSKRVAYTSKSISELLNLDLNKYNSLLINKVIQHEDFIADQYTNDLSFMLNNTTEETYLNRFKETFSKELTMLALGGV